MIEIQNRENEIAEYLREYMEDCYFESCKMIQKEVEMHGDKIWNELSCVIRNVMKQVLTLQENGQKNRISYFTFCFLKNGISMNKIGLYIAAFDNGFYLDEQETAICFYPLFLQSIYRNDIILLQRRAEEKFIRLQSYELTSTKERYGHFFNAIMFRMIESLKGLIMREIEESGIKIEEQFKIIYGGYMEPATVVYIRE